MRRLIQLIEHYSAIYFCEVAAFCVLGSHYHLIAKFDGLREVSRDELRARSRLMYPSRASQAEIDLWSEEDWEHYRRRLFDVSEYMRNIQSAFARWYNRNYQRRGQKAISQNVLNQEIARGFASRGMYRKRLG